MAKKRNTIYIAYGSNMSVEQMKFRCPAAKLLGTGTLNNWQLQFKVHATVKRAKGYAVPVLLWELTEVCEQALDRYEGFRPLQPHMGYYHKQNVRIKIGESTRLAMLYVMNPRHLCLPHREYYNVISDAYNEFGFDKNILQTAIDECRRGTPARVAEETH